MLKTESVISEESRSVMEKYLQENFSFEEGSDLDAGISEVLNDRQVFTFLAALLPKNKGLELGTVHYFDDIGITVHYGLFVDLENLPRKTKIFTYEESIGGIEKPKLGLLMFPSYKIYDGFRPPTPEQFIQEVNYALSNPKGCLVDLLER